MQNTTECVKIALENPPKVGEKYRVFNQTTECHNIKILANKISNILIANKIATIPYISKSFSLFLLFELIG